MDFNCFAWSFRNASWTFFSLDATILGTTILPWSFVGQTWHTRGHFRFFFCRLEVFIAPVEVFLPSCYTKMRPYSPWDSGSQLPSFFCNYFIIRCRNLREFLQDLRARDFQWLSDFFSPNICVAKFRSILFLFSFFVYYCFFISSFFVCRQRQT